MNRVEATASCRIDFAGGTLDIWPLGLLHPGARTVNVAVDLRQSVTVSGAPRDAVVTSAGRCEFDDRAAWISDPRFGLLGRIVDYLGSPSVEVSVESPLPPGSGLGGSSALTVALLAAVSRLGSSRSIEARVLARWARDLEAQHMGLPTGLQDHYPALLGGALDIRHQVGGEDVRRVEVDCDELAEHLVVAHTGAAHVSAAQNWRVIRSRLDGELVAVFEQLRAAADRAASALAAADYRALGEAMAADWAGRRSLGEGVSTPAIEAALATAAAAGAWGGKACGAGGGGCVAILVPRERRAALVATLERGATRVLACRPVNSPLELRSSP
jgi:D-glycero-alpha-D-manno-heptose-7-phosphate kinase